VAIAFEFTKPRLHDYTIFVYTVFVKNITLSADEDLIERARLVARGRRTTLNAAFREWLEDFTIDSGSIQSFDALMKRLKYVNAGRKFTREEMNER
jgi:hypothetical protein